MSSSMIRNVFVPAIIGGVTAGILFGGGLVRKALIAGVVFVAIFFVLRILNGSRDEYSPEKKKKKEKVQSEKTDARKWLDDLLVRQQGRQDKP